MRRIVAASIATGEKAVMADLSHTSGVPRETEPHLLVVDDDKRLRELLRRYLSDNGFRVTTAADARDARSNLASFAFDLLVLDVMLPGENGLELTRALRRENPIPVLLLTAMGEPEDRVNGLEQGADDYLSKPFEPRELVLRIRNVLQRRPAAIPPRRESALAVVDLIWSAANCTVAAISCI